LLGFLENSGLKEYFILAKTNAEKVIIHRPPIYCNGSQITTPTTNGEIYCKDLSGYSAIQSSHTYPKHEIKLLPVKLNLG
jgi:hypothetical protein